MCVKRYDHETDEDYLKMTEREEDVMKMIGLVP
jgi:ssRNA-specific RNase YbeY (16S rRNA maturation enzyme)